MRGVCFVIVVFWRSLVIQDAAAHGIDASVDGEQRMMSLIECALPVRCPARPRQRQLLDVFYGRKFVRRSNESSVYR